MQDAIGKSRVETTKSRRGSSGTDTGNIAAAAAASASADIAMESSGGQSSSAAATGNEAAEASQPMATDVNPDTARVRRGKRSAEGMGRQNVDLHVDRRC